MATSIYIYKQDDTLIKLADRFNTSVNSIVRLNSWLKDVNTGKTHIKISDSLTSQNLNIADAQTTNFKFTVMPKPNTASAQCIYTNNSKVVFTENENNELVYNDIVLGELHYNDGTITILLPLNQFKSIQLSYKQDYWPDRIILPIVANGNISMEDYWKVLNGITGIQIESQLENNASESRTALTNARDIDDIFYFDKEFRLDGYGNSLPIQMYSDANKLDGYELPMNGVPNVDADYIQDAFAIGLQSQLLGISDKSKTNGLETNNSNYILDSYIKDNKNYTKTQIITCLPTETKTIITVGDTTIYLPIVPESISEGSTAQYSSQSILGSSEPYRVYNTTSVRTQQFSGLTIHRDMTRGSTNLFDNNILEQIAGIIQSGTYPNYSGEVAPLRTTVRVLNQDYISGIMTSSTIEFSGPLMANVGKNNVTDWMSGKYSVLTISFTVEEVNTESKGASEVRDRWTSVKNSGKGKNNGISIY